MTIRVAWLALFIALPGFGAISGTVVNKTTGKPAAGVAISLVRPGQNGMVPVGSATTDDQGSYRFEPASGPPGPQLLQANYRGINYNKLLTPNVPTTGVEVDVYEATKSAAGVRVVQRMLIFEPNSSQVAMNETVILQNDTNTTFHDPAAGDFLFYLPPAANGQVRISAQGPGGMPLPRPAEKTAETDVFKVDFPVKPGETQLEITYNLAAGSPLTYRGEVVSVKGMQGGPYRLVAPQGVELSGKDIEKVGTEPKTQATIFNVVGNKLFSVEVKGTGGLRGADGAASADESDSPPVTEGKPQVYAHLPWLMALGFGILGVGLFYLFRISTPAATAVRHAE